MGIITLTTDWGTKDHYLGAVKGRIHRQLDDVQIVDISHHVEPFHSEDAAFILKGCFEEFPAGTVHIIGVNTEESAKEPHVLIKYRDHFFIGCDNGVFSMIMTEKPQLIVELNVIQDSGYFTFASRDRFVKAAIHLLKGEDPLNLGTQTENLNQKLLFKPVTEKNLIKGMVIYVDNYENVITNISKSLFDEIGENRQFVIQFRGESISRINTSYQDVPLGEIVAIFGSHGNMEISINQGNASSLLGLHKGDSVMVNFEH